MSGTEPEDAQASVQSQRGDRRAHVKNKVSQSAAGRLWARLDATDFLNRAMLFAAVLFLCFVPFVLVVQALAGRDAITSLVRRFGLTPDAAHAVSSALTTPSATSGAVTGVGYVLFVLGGVAAAGAIQELYERSFELERRGVRDTLRRVAWLALALGAVAAASWIGPTLHAVGGPVLLAAAGLLGLTGFWWLTMWLLLAGRRHWRTLFPSAVATAVCWLGMSIVFRLTMSGTITSNYAKYGTIGVVLALMSYLIAIGVVIILGAVVGAIWDEWRGQRSAESDGRIVRGEGRPDVPAGPSSDQATAGVADEELEVGE